MSTKPPRSINQDVAAQHVTAALKRRFAPPAHIYMEQVRNGTGYARDLRTADGMALSIWPSRGLELHGIEIKVSRGDWLRELADPAKAEELARFCDRWWIAASDESIVAEGELPKGWGLLVLRKEAMVQLVEAPELRPEPWDRLFMVSLMRRAFEVGQEKNQATVDLESAAFERGRERGRNEVLADGGAPHQLRQLQARVDTFEAKSGLKIGGYDGEKIADAVKTLMAGANAAKRLADVREMAARVVKQLKDVEKGCA